MRTGIIKVITICLFLMAMTFLQGCADVAMSGAQAVYNRHSIQKNLSDQYITMQAFQALHHKTDKFKNTNIAISTFNSDVLLAGQVPEQWQKAKAEQIVKTIPDVNQVYNLLSISNPSSTLTRISDAWITAKVKAKLLASGDVDATQIKVVTENGTVYLMGILKPEEAQAAVDVASTTDGVESVVKVFWYVKISKVL
jgi:osmotically-inducible protein OsmY